ncbi:DUF968 domain-containing protein [Candidatus Parcubacteria bacterium]|nr:MAG: DUF968 domain-containing protein [Candidatus Parcubacteria bacterium]
MIVFRKKPWRSEKHLKYIRSLPCCACGSPGPNDAHHIISVGNGRMGSTAPDSHAIPLCRVCHMRLHDKGIGISDQWRWLALTLAEIVEGNR